MSCCGALPDTNKRLIPQSLSALRCRLNCGNIIVVVMKPGGSRCRVHLCWILDNPIVWRRNGFGVCCGFLECEGLAFLTVNSLLILSAAT